MAHITENDYKKLANAVADDLLNQKIPLNNSVNKLAREMDMSHEQIRRLCEASNNATFGKMFESKGKSAEDRTVEFDVADADVVLNDAIKEAHYDGSGDPLVYLSEFRSLDDTDDEPTEVKVASDEEYVPPVRAEVDRRTLRKTLDHLRHEKIAADLAYGDTMANLKNRFRRLYQDISFESFEKEAAAIHGAAVLGPLTDLRRELRLPEMEYDYAQLEKQAGYVDNDRFEHKLLADAITHKTRLNQVNDGIAKLESVL